MICLFTPQSEKDLDDIALYIARDNPKRASAFVFELRSHCMKVAVNPLIYALREEYGSGVRMTVHGNYLIFHTISTDALIIERIIHAARQRVKIIEEKSS